MMVSFDCWFEKSNRQKTTINKEKIMKTIKITTNGTTTLLKITITIMSGSSISPNPARIPTTQMSAIIPNRKPNALPAALLPKNSDIRIQNTIRFIIIFLTFLSVVRSQKRAPYHDCYCHNKSLAISLDTDAHRIG